MCIFLIFNWVRPWPTKLSGVDLIVSVHSSVNIIWLHCIIEDNFLQPIVPHFLSFLLNWRDRDGCRIFLMLRWVVCCTFLLNASGGIKYFWGNDSEVIPWFPFYTPTLATLTLALIASYKLFSSVKSTAYSSLVEIWLIFLRPLDIFSWLMTCPLK